MVKKWEILTTEKTPKEPGEIVNLLLKQRGIITEKDKDAFYILIYQVLRQRK